MVESTDQSIKKTELQTEQQTAVVYKDAGDIENDRDLLERIKNRERTHKGEIDTLVKSAEENELYYYAQYIDDSQLLDSDADVQVPKLFENLETLIPLVTRQTPQPNLTVLPKNRKESTKLEKLLSSYLTDKWQLSEMDEGLEMQPKQEENMRNLFTQRGQMYKVVWDTEYACPYVMPVRLEDLCFPKDARNEQEASFVIHYTISTLGDLCERFPDKEETLIEMLSSDSENISMDSLVKHIEYWENDFVAWAYKDLLLGRERNPYFNWDNREFNHFKRPMKPFIFETDVRHGDGLMGKTTFIEMSKSLVRNLDKRKRYIDRNAKMANGLIAVNGNVITKENAALIGRDTDQTIFIEDGDIDKSVRILTADPISQAVVNDMNHDEAHIDKVTRINDTLRGERTAQETAEGRRLLKESALGGLEVIFRMNERVAQKVYNWLVQFLYVFTTEEGQRVYGAEIETGFSEKITREMLKGVKILCYVKDGSTFPDDKMTTETQAIERFKIGLLSKVDALKMLNDPEAESHAYNRYLEDTNPPALYDPAQKQGVFDPLAIMHTYDLIAGREVPPYRAQDLQTMQKHVDAHQSWLDGKQLDEGLPFVEDLDFDKVVPIKLHIEEEAKILAEMIAMEQANNPVPMASESPMMPMAEPAVSGAQIPQEMPAVASPIDNPVL